jgi:acetyl esterase/lipase
MTLPQRLATVRQASFRAKRSLLLVVLCGLVFAIFVPYRAASEYFLHDPSIVIECGIPFRHVDGIDLKLDMARPANGEGPFPALVFIHGGGWRYSGNAFQTSLPEAAKRGYVVIRISYRLLDVQKDGHAKHPFPAQIEDVAASIDWLKRHARQYHVDADRIGLAGKSAGGQLALLAALVGQYSSEPGEIKAVVNFYGPTDLLSTYQNRADGRSLLRILLEGTPDEVPDQYIAASPVNFLRKDGPPILTIHGADDQVVLIEQARLLDAKAHAIGEPHTLVVLDGESHGFSGPADKQANEMMYDFFARFLAPQSTSVSLNKSLSFREPKPTAP